MIRFMTEATVVQAAPTLTIVAVRGRLDPEGVAAVDSKVTAETIGRGKPAIVDLTGVDFIGSMGIGMVIGLGRSMRKQRLGYAIVATSIVKDVLDRLSIPDLFPVVASRDEALESLGLK